MPGQQREGEAHRREVVHRHDALDVVGGHRRGAAALRDAGVVHQHVDATQLRVGPRRERVDAVEVGEVDDPASSRREGRRAPRRAGPPAARRCPTVAPRRANAIAVAAPMPDDAPVTRTFTDCLAAVRGAQAVLPAHPARPGDRLASGGVGDRAPQRARRLDHVDGHVVTGELGEERAPLLHAHRFVTTPVHDPRRHRRGLEQRRGLLVDVVLVDRHVGARVPPRRDPLARHRGVEVVHGQAAVGTVRSVHARDRDRQVELPRARAGHGLLGDLRHRVRRRERRVHLTERVGLARTRAADRRAAGTPNASTSPARPWPLRQCASSRPVPSAFTVIAWSKSRPGPLERGEVHDVGEVVGHAGEVAARDVAHTRASRPSASTCARLSVVGEAGDPPHLVVGREVAGERERDLPGGSGDEDLLAREHGR